MRLIPVLDVRAGQAVHAIAGDREHYRPVRSVVHPGTDPVALARAFRDRFGFNELYLADLDAIAGGAPAVALYQQIAALGLAVWIDAGVRDRTTHDRLGLVGREPERARTVPVLGLETLRGPEALAAIVAGSGPAPLAFSLDLRDGRPLVPTRSTWGTDDPLALVRAVVKQGLHRLILLDLARVGTGRGVGTLPLLTRLRAEYPALEIVVGGGVAGPEDLAEIERRGASAALVASALHEGRIQPTDPR